VYLRHPLTAFRSTRGFSCIRAVCLLACFIQLQVRCLFGRLGIFCPVLQSEKLKFMLPQFLGTFWKTHMFAGVAIFHPVMLRFVQNGRY